MKSIFTQLSFRILFLALFIADSASASVVYVSSGVTSSGAGTTWGSAYKTLQEALDAASANSNITQVWVKAGTYYPTAYPIGSTGGSTERDYAFSLRNGLAIYGGFAGTETTITGRTAGNTTTLSGDIGVPGDNSDNCYHVVIADHVDYTAVLDGITITLGKADGGNTIGTLNTNRSNAGGLYNIDASPTISACVLSRNFANYFGGGMYNVRSSPIITGCTFLADTVSTSTGNQAQGGGICNREAGRIVINNCLFSGNIAASAPLGAATYAVAGGIQNDSGCTLTLGNCNFSGNAMYGNFAGVGGIESSGILTANNCVFYNNTAGATGALIGTGGAFQNSRTGNASFTNCIFVGNKANGTDDDGGGAIMNYSGTVALTNCTLLDNTTSSSYNTTANAVSTYPGGTTVITNSILWGASAQVFNRGTTTVSYSNIKGGYTGTGNIEADPSFADAAEPAGADGIWADTDDGLALKACSPSINTGTAPSPAVPNDYLGNARAGAYDMGAYEYQGTFVQPTLATGSVTYTAEVATTTTFGDCNTVIATVAPAGATPVSGSATAKVYVQSSAPTYNSQPYVRRTYDIRPVANADAATATMTLYFLQGDFTDYNTNRGTFSPLPTDATDAAGYRANLRIYQQHGTSTTGNLGSYTGWGGTGPANLDIIPTTVTYNTTSARWEATFPVTGFSGFFAHTGTLTALPIKLLSFTANNAGSRNRIEWNTATEDPGTSFEITRSSDGTSFGKVGAAPGKGHDASYAFYDDRPMDGTNYYRLKIIGADGAATFSNVAIVRNDGAKGSISVAPVPATGTVTISNTNTALTGTSAIVYDMQGRAVYNFTLSTNNQINVATWAAGIYSLRLVDGTTVRLVKQ